MIRLLLVLLITGLALAAGTGNDSPATPDARTTLSRGLPFASPSTSLAAFISKTVTDIARNSGDTRSVRVNQIYAPQDINVVLLDFRRIPPGKIPLPSAGIYSVRPNVLVIDTNMAHSLLLNAFNEALSFTQMLMNQDLREKHEVRETDTLLNPASEGSLAFHLRLRNLRFQQALGSLSDDISALATEPSMQTTLGMAFVFPVGHEIYHLRPSAYWLPPIPYFIEREEASADEHARRLIEQRLPGTSPLAFENVVKTQASVLSLRHFQDIVLSEAFHDLRHLNAEDYLAVLFHRPCESASRIPWPQRFHNPDVVFEAAQRNFPVLSEQEFAQIGERMKRFKNETHGSLLLRILQMRTAFKKNENWGPIVDSDFQYADMLQSAFFSSAGPSALTGNDDGGATTANVSLDGLLNHLSEQQHWQRGAGCMHDECGLVLWTDGYMEAKLRKGLVLHLRIVEPFSKDTLARTYKAAAFFFGEHEATKLEDAMRTSSMSCKVGTFSYDNGTYTMLSHVLNETGIIETEIEANAASARTGVKDTAPQICL